MANIIELLRENLKEDGRFSEEFNLAEILGVEDVNCGCSPGSWESGSYFNLYLPDIEHEDCSKVLYKYFANKNYDIINAIDGFNILLGQLDRTDSSRTMYAMYEAIVQKKGRYSLYPYADFFRNNIEDSKDISTTKLSLLMLALTNDTSVYDIFPKLRDDIIMLSRYDEFALGSLHCMQQWDDDNEIMIKNMPYCGDWGMILTAAFCDNLPLEEKKLLFKRMVNFKDDKFTAAVMACPDVLAIFKESRRLTLDEFTLAVRILIKIPEILTVEFYENSYKELTEDYVMILDNAKMLQKEGELTLKHYNLIYRMLSTMNKIGHKYFPMQSDLFDFVNQDTIRKDVYACDTDQLIDVIDLASKFGVDIENKADYLVTKYPDRIVEILNAMMREKVLITGEVFDTIVKITHFKELETKKLDSSKSYYFICYQQEIEILKLLSKYKFQGRQVIISGLNSNLRGIYLQTLRTLVTWSRDMKFSWSFFPEIFNELVDKYYDEKEYEMLYLIKPLLFSNDGSTIRDIENKTIKKKETDIFGANKNLNKKLN